MFSLVQTVVEVLFCSIIPHGLFGFILSSHKKEKGLMTTCHMESQVADSAINYLFIDVIGNPD